MNEFQDNSKLNYSGPAVAASLAPLMGFLTLAVTHHLSRLNTGLENIIHSWGYWIPGAVGSGPNGSIGSYSGKETLALLVWGGSWIVFHLAWRKQDFSLHRWIPLFAALLFMLGLGFVHPVIDPFVLALASLTGLR